MTDDNYHWMKYAVEYKNELNNNSLKVTAIVINEKKLLDVVCTNNDNDISWADELLLELCDKGINEIDKLFLTINTLNNEQEFDLNILLKKIKVKEIFLGLPDPKLDTYLNNDPVLNNKNVFRFTEDLQEEIFKQNYSLYSDSNQNIKYNEYYYNNRISNFLKEKLNLCGIKLETDEISKQKHVDKLSSYISRKFKIAKKTAYELITNILSEAFDYKYSTYNYANDIRSVNKDWSKTFNDIYNKTNNISLSEINILNVGVGSGTEASELFLNCDNITFVDIAPNGLKNIKGLIPKSNTIQDRAENLSILKDNSYELYVSLRTYNSSFFDIEKAIKEAYRVLKNDSVIIISISNGFLDSKKKQIIPGIIISKLNFVDLYRGLDMIRNLSNILLDFNFDDIELTPTNGEIYISARVRKS